MPFLRMLFPLGPSKISNYQSGRQEGLCNNKNLVFEFSYQIPFKVFMGFSFFSFSILIQGALLIMLQAFLHSYIIFPLCPRFRLLSSSPFSLEIIRFSALFINFCMTSTRLSRLAFGSGRRRSLLPRAGTPPTPCCLKLPSCFNYLSPTTGDFSSCKRTCIRQ